MQIRPGVTLLQAIAKASEARPVPFSERLTDLQAGTVPGPITDTPLPATAATKDARDAKPASASPPRNDAVASASAAQPTKPRGSLLDIVV